MNNNDLKIILDKHNEWWNNEEGGERADLREADLRGADLREADLRGADLCEADLRGANLRGANLCEVDLCGANLRGADLCEADLRGADLRGADLYEANLRGANLYEANLRGANLCEADLREADLCEADLRGANLRGADLSMAENLLSAIAYIKDNFETINEGIIVYKTFGGSYNPPKKWVIRSGSVLSENCDMNRTDLCGCGINVASIEWVKKNYIGDIWKCLIRWEWLCGVCVPYNTDGKIRAEMVELIEIVDRD